MYRTSCPECGGPLVAVVTLQFTSPLDPEGYQLDWDDAATQREEAHCTRCYATFPLAALETNNDDA